MLQASILQPWIQSTCCPVFFFFFPYRITLARGVENNLQRVKTRHKRQFFSNVRIDPKNLKKFIHALEQLNYKSTLSDFLSERCKFNKI